MAIKSVWKNGAAYLGLLVVSAVMLALCQCFHQAGFLQRFLNSFHGELSEIESLIQEAHGLLIRHSEAQGNILISDNSAILGLQSPCRRAVYCHDDF